LGQVSPVAFEQRFGAHTHEQQHPGGGISTAGACVIGAAPPVEIPHTNITEIA
jgi:hypothetical protein